MLELLLANPQKAEARMAKFEEKMEAAMECQMKHLKAIHERMMAKLYTNQESLMAHPGTKEIDPDPRKMPSAEEHHEIPNKEATVAPVKGLKQRRRVCNLATEHHQKKLERTQGNHGSRRKSPATCRKVSHHATMTWRKWKLFRKSGTQENCGPHKELTAAGMRKSPEGNDGIRRQDVKELPHLRKMRMMNCIKGSSAGQQSYLGRGGTLRMNLYEIFREIFKKTIVRTPS
jgi:hypothetical protein